MPVNKPREDYDKILPKWQRLRDCSKGRDAVLEAGNKYVPELPGADTAQNKAYRERGNFYNALSRTVQGLNGAIFQEAPEVKIPETFKAILQDVTLTNVTFESFSTETGKEIFLTGRYGILVDMPVAPVGVAPAGSAQAKNIVDMRPYCVGYNAESIINWRTERRGGDNILTMVVLREKAELTPVANEAGKTDLFSAPCVEQFRVVMLNPTGQCIVQLWRQVAAEKAAAGGSYEQIGEDQVLMRRGEALTFVPFVFLGALKPSPDLEQPPLIDLADVNLGHWRNSVDYEYGLHLVALPTPWVAGAKGTGDTKMKMGPSVVWDLEVQGSAGMLEFTGAGLGAIVVAMEEKKKQMATLGARLLEDAPTTAETASAVKLRHGGETASLKTVAQGLEQGLSQTLQIAVWWLGTNAKPSDTEVVVALNKEYLNIRATPQEIQTALTALQAGEMSFETWYALLASGGWAREGVDVEQEQKDIAKRKIDVTEPTLDPSLQPQP